jgi:replicative DNA helicase
MTETTRAAERDFMASVMDAVVSGETDCLTVIDPEHIADKTYRDMIIRIKDGAGYVDLLNSPFREQVFSLGSIGDVQHSRHYLETLYSYVRDNWIKSQVRRAALLASGQEYGIDQLASLQEEIKRIDNSISIRRRSSAAEAFRERILSDKAIIPTHIKKLDEMLDGGFEEKEKVVIAARPSGGKTSIACYIARLMVESGEPVGFWSVESPDDQIMRRVLASKHRTTISAIKAHSKRNPVLSDAQIQTMIDSANKLESMGLNILKGSGRTAKQIAGEIMSSPERVCIVDHLQKFRGGDMRLSVGDASHDLSHAANAKGKVVIMLSQLSRAVEGRANEEPRLSDLKESGDIEQDADTIIFIHNTSRTPDGSEDIASPIVDVRLIIAKKRDGGRGIVSLKFNRAIGEFVDTDFHELNF